MASIASYLKIITTFFFRHQAEIEKMMMYIVQAIAEDAITKRKNKSTKTA